MYQLYDTCVRSLFVVYGDVWALELHKTPEWSRIAADMKHILLHYGVRAQRVRDVTDVCSQCIMRAEMA